MLYLLKKGTIRKSQVSLFIILGIIVLVLSGFLFYVMSLNKSISRRYSGKHSEVNNYIAHCLEETAKEAIMLAGQQAGYVNISPIVSSFSSADALNSPVFSVNGKYTMPYWLYQDEIDDSFMPELYKAYDGDNSIQDQIESYIDNNLKTCINSFKPFEKQGIRVEELSKPKSRVIFLDSKTKVLLSYNIIVTETHADGAESREAMSDFEADIKARVKKVYSLAREIYSYELTNVFLEQKTKDFITMYSAVDDSYLPPMYGGLYFDDCSNRVQWLYNDVYNNFKEMLESNIPFLKIDNTDYSPVALDRSDYDNAEDYRIAQGVFNGMVIKAAKSNYPDIRADIAYMHDFPLELGFGDNRQILKPNSFEVDMLFFKKCMFEYRFTYNIKYPVLISLVDEDSDINGNKFLFQFPVLVVIKDNFPRVNVNDIENFPKYKKEPSYECSAEYRVADAQITVKDSSGNAVDQASVYFQCGPSFVYSYDDEGNLANATPFAKRCFIGKTEKGVLKAKLPFCINGGKITIEKTGYLPLSDFTGNIDQKTKISKSYTLEEMKEVNIVVKKYRVGLNSDDNSLISCNAVSDALPLDMNEDAVVKLTFTNNGFVYLARYNNYNKTKLKLAPGNYNFDIMLIRNEKYPGEMTIKKDSEHKTVKSGLFKEKTIYYPDHDIEMQKAITGAAYFNFTITRKMLDSGTIIVYVLDSGKPARVEDVGKIMMFKKQCSDANMNKIIPRAGK